MSSSRDYADEKLPDMQKIQHASAKTQAEGTFDVICMWNVKDVVTMSAFDATTSNSVWKG